MRMRNFVLATLLALPAASSFAITYGQPDGNDHPFVGALVGQFTSGQFPYCSGTLISPTVFLTAAHCNIGRSRVFVTFDPAHTTSSKLYSGTYYPDPDYTQQQDDPHDLAVVVLDKPMKGLTPARLPTLGQFDSAAKGLAFTAVGYGGQERNIGPGGPVISYEDTREFAVSTLSAVGPGYLRLSQNAATGDGGTCYGDSGGPNFLGAGASETNIIGGTTITGDSQCVSTNVIQRLDTVASRRFLGRFVTLP
jgi:hypothetical protein